MSRGATFQAPVPRPRQAGARGPALCRRVHPRFPALAREEALDARFRYPERRRIFDPTNLTDGIDLSADPILPARSAAYSVSYERRSKGQ